MSFSDRFAWQLTQLSHKAKRPLLITVKHNRALQRLSQVIQFFDPENTVMAFPDWETLPYERLAPTLTQVTQRLRTLNQIQRAAEGIIITTPLGLLQRLAPSSYINGHVFRFSLTDTLDTIQLNQQLIHCGYQRVSTVTFPNEFVVRGEIIDIFPPDTALPLRIHLNVDLIERLYHFDPVTQHAKEALDTIQIIPTREFLLSEESIQRFQQQGQHLLGKQFLESIVNQQLSTTSYAAGTEYYLPLFFEKTQTLIEYLPRHTHWVQSADLQDLLFKSWNDINTRYQQVNGDIKWPILSPDTLYQAPKVAFQQLNVFKSTSVDDNACSTLPEISEDHLKSGLIKLKAELNALTDTKIVFCTTRLSQQALLIQKLADIAIYPTPIHHWNDCLHTSDHYYTIVAPIKKGFQISKEKIWIISEADLDATVQDFTLRITPQNIKAKPEDAFNDLSQLVINDFVVHVDHGIGRYLGLQHLSVSEHTEEFIVLAYAENTKLYVPIQDVGYISRYSGQENPSLHYLNSTQWKKTKQRALVQLKDTAAELLELYAQRANAQGEAFNAPDSEYKAFVEAFAFEETADQKTAIAEVITDLCDTKPMDRLICGDVGFGKTEVAMRAAFLAVQSGKQVAILAPTTLLVDQHYRNFKERFSDFPITIEWLSRFRKPTDNRSTQQSIQTGIVDIVIGTHALLSKTIKFKNLGLLIIDEEHHFGVQQKERLALFKTQVNVLTLTATPIPRTLQTALSGLRELSLITTPPVGRLPIKNFITERSTTAIQEAISRELLRGGQVYFVHNRIGSLPRIKRELQALCPEAHIGVAHGQLAENALESCMNAFHQQQYNVLLCTSIIETGLDIPTVNTLIVDRADHFGLAQLHQLRGRVGRSHHQAYAYFLVSDESYLTKDAQKRLKALDSLATLGSGFNLASQDLDIRGAGELLGDRQSGTLQGIGFSLYMELLEKTIQTIKENPQNNTLESTIQGTTIDIKIAAFIPDAYLPDVATRLQYYKRITSASNAEHLQHLHLALLDRYGLLPQEAQNLFAINVLKKEAEQLGIAKIEAKATGGRIEFHSDNAINPGIIIQLIQKEPNQFKLIPYAPHKQPRLGFTWPHPVPDKARIDAVRTILKRLSGS